MTGSKDKDLQDEGAAGASNADAANGAKDADAATQRPKYRRKTKAEVEVSAAVEMTDTPESLTEEGETIGAAAIPIRPAIRSGRASATSSISQPPIDEPIRICGPSVSSSITARLSSAQRLMVPSRKSPSDRPWPL